MTSLVGVAYCSRPVDFSFERIGEILEASRRNNEVNKLTGALVYDNKTFLQWLEGGAAEIRTVFDDIFHDRRHADVKLLTVRRLEDRLFPDWTMTAAVTQDQTLRGLKLVPHLSLSRFNPVAWSESDVVGFMDALSDYLTRRPAPKSVPLEDRTGPVPHASDPMTRLDQHLCGIA